MNRNQHNDLEFSGKLPPQAIELEEAVLGAIMLEKNAFEVVADLLKPESFYKNEHGLVYKAFISLVNKRSVIDILTTTQELRSMGLLESVGGGFYVTQLTNRVASAANIQHHAKVIQDKFIQRELLRIASEVQRLAYEDTGNPYEILDYADKSIASLGAMGIETVDWVGQLKAAITYIENIDRSTGISGVPSGINNIDNLTKGWQNGELIVLAARPGMGKTVALIVFAIMAARAGFPVDIYSLEMTGLALIIRMLAGEAKIDGEKLKSGELTDKEWLSLTDARSRLGDLPIHLDDFPSQKPESVRRKIKKGVKERGTKLVLIDYLQLMDASDAEGGKANTDTQMGYISRTLKRTAKECNIPVIALASLSRDVEKRGGSKRPVQSDIRSSGNIESDADVVAFLYRPEYYGITEDEQGNSTIGLTEFIIAKHRNGKTDTAFLKFNGAHSMFTDWEVDPFEQHLNSAKKDSTPF